ncbi:hypothetical protein ACFFRR_009762 [Megaselia abdita]
MEVKLENMKIHMEQMMKALETANIQNQRLSTLLVQLIAVVHARQNESNNKPSVFPQMFQSDQSHNAHISRTPIHQSFLSVSQANAANGLVSSASPGHESAFQSPHTK